MINKVKAKKSYYLRFFVSPFLNFIPNKFSLRTREVSKLGKDQFSFLMKYLYI